MKDPYRHEIWLFFDRDEHPTWEETILKAQKEKFHLGISNPCFEVWALLHFRRQNAFISRGNCQKILEDYLPSYNHRNNPILSIDALLPLLEQAKQNAVQIFDEDRGLLIKNPSTTVWQFLDVIGTI